MLVGVPVAVRTLFRERLDSGRGSGEFNDLARSVVAANSPDAAVDNLQQQLATESKWRPQVGAWGTLLPCAHVTVAGGMHLACSCWHRVYTWRAAGLQLACTASALAFCTSVDALLQPGRLG